jgi:hypothetical protein
MLDDNTAADDFDFGAFDAPPERPSAPERRRAPPRPARPGYGATVADCRVSWRAAPLVTMNGTRQRRWRQLSAVTVTNIGRNLVQWTRPRCGEVVRARLTGKHIEIVAPDGTDLVAEWRE